MAQKRRQTVAEGFVLDFPGVGGADRGQLVGQLQAGLEKGELAVVFDPVEAPGGFWQAESGPQAGREAALEGDVVYRHDAGRPAFVMQVGGRQGGLPVVDMDHVGAPVEGRAGLAEEGGEAGQEAEAPVVVAPVVTVGVEVGVARAVVQFGAVDKIQRQAVGPRRQQAAGWEQRGQGRQGGGRPGLGKGGGEGRVARHEHPHVLAGLPEGRREGGGHVAQAPGLDPGGDFRGGEEDVHGAMAWTSRTWAIRRRSPRIRPAIWRRRAGPGRRWRASCRRRAAGCRP